MAQVRATGRTRRRAARTRREQLSVRIDPQTLARLEQHARRVGQSRSALVQRYLEEGLRLEEHPGIVFVGDPTDRRATLRRRPGLEIWEVIGTVEVNRSAKEAAEYLHLTPSDMEVALRYYADYRDEVDGLIHGNREIAAREEAAWRRSRTLSR